MLSKTNPFTRGKYTLQPTKHDNDVNMIGNFKKPFIAGGYTQEDWDILNGSNFDIEFYDDYCETPMDRTEYIALVTKPKWA